MSAFRLITAVVVGATVLVAAPASADSKVRSDARHDVRYVSRDDQGDFGGRSTAIPSRRLGDITSLRVTHGPRKITATLKFRALRKEGSHTHWFQLRTPRRTVDVFLQADRESWKGSRLIYELGDEDNEFSCRFSHRIDYRADTVTVVVPRTCLLRPAFVRVGAETMIESGGHRFYDKAPQRGGPYNAGPPRGPRVHR
ncbi:hypothetical protein ABIE44_001637 [Marmoricola sp. OAE513]|uniref:hypothetical protein n=1 Tax=Marmoricola sp. OAE513 TaxID=2817894 RepID=UPI001AE14ED8